MEETINFGVPWEADFGYSQAVCAGNLIFISGQLSHDEQGNFAGEGNFEEQLRQTYANMKSLLGNCADKILTSEGRKNGRITRN